eukprot:5407787-Pleurochrysis_carterae.AAC.1
MSRRYFPCADGSAPSCGRPAHTKPCATEHTHTASAAMAACSGESHSSSSAGALTRTASSWNSRTPSYPRTPVYNLPFAFALP